MGLGLILFVAGAVGGFLVGMLGIGGGLVYIAILHSVFAAYSLDSFEATRYVLANAILVQAVAGVVASYRQHKAALLHWREVLQVGIPTAIVSMSLSYVVKSSNWYKREYFLVLFIIFLVISIYRIVSNKGNKDDTSEWQWEEHPGRTYWLTGGLAGVISALAGLGGGIFIIPWLSTRHKLPVKQAVAIAIPAVVFGAFGNALVYMLDGNTTIQAFHTGYIVWSVTLPMIAGVVIFTQLGVMAATKISTGFMRKLFALLLAGMAAKLLVIDILMRFL